MKVDNLIVKWRYEQDFINPSDLDSTEITTCVVVLAEEEKVIAQGIAWKSHKDVYCKETGRRISMQRALLNSNLNKAQRSKVWEAYRTLTKVPRWEVKKQVQSPKVKETCL